ncbi:ISLre2 family transposase, partial [Tetragenococcus koreensis]|nr:ISLre2 family transposase [Tetragenococcus koreensis]
KVKERLYFVPQLQPKMQEALRQYDWDKVQTCLDTAESLIEEDEEKANEQLRLLSAYFVRNWPYLRPLKDRGVQDPQA